MLKKFVLLLALIFFAASPNVEAEIDTVANVYSEDDNEALGIIRDDGSLFFLFGRKDQNAFAVAPYSRETYDFCLNENEPLIFMMLVLHDGRGQLDEELGQWKDDMHMLPVFARFGIQDGQIFCQKPFYSMNGSNHQEITNPKYERLVEVFMTLMPELHVQVNGTGVSLP